MSNDAPMHDCESEIDHYTGHYVPYSLWRVCGFFNVPQIYYMCKGLWDGAYGLSSLSEKTRKSNRLQMLLQRQHFLLSYLKILSVGPVIKTGWNAKRCSRYFCTILLIGLSSKIQENFAKQHVYKSLSQNLIWVWIKQISHFRNIKLI